MTTKQIQGFSKLSKEEKIDWIANTFLTNPEETKEILSSFWQQDDNSQRVFDGFSENTISNFHLPYGIAPNFLIDGEYFAVPMVIEESSVVAAAASAAKYWSSRGGIKTQILGTTKIGQVSFKWSGDKTVLELHFKEIKSALHRDVTDITHNMSKRGGGILDIELVDLSSQVTDVYQIKASFETCDSMGANFINTCLEQFAMTLKSYATDHLSDQGNLEIVMCILSNYTDGCVVRAYVECPVEKLQVLGDNANHIDLSEKFKTAVDIAIADPYRAVTHNKGIFNGIDSVVLATGNDFRAIEACGHAYASRSGQYRSLSTCTIKDGMFRFELELPLAVGTVGGLTKLHPLAKISLSILDNPSASQLMRIIAATGLAQNFAALKSLVTTGIQRGHMKMHLQNILNQLEATAEENQCIVNNIGDKHISYNGVRKMIDEMRATV